MTTSTDLTTIEANALRVLRDEGPVLSKVLAALLDAARVEPAAKTKVAPKVALTEKITLALKKLPEVFGRVQPDVARELSPGEVVSLDAEKEVLDDIVKALKTRSDAIGVIIRHHMAEKARREGKVTEATPLDAKGFPIIAAPQQPQQVQVPESDRAWSLEYRQGSVSIDAAELLALYEAEEITREDYLAFTRETRVFDETKAMRAIAKEPSRMSILRKITKRGRASTSLFVRQP